MLNKRDKTYLRELRFPAAVVLANFSSLKSIGPLRAYTKKKTLGLLRTDEKPLLSTKLGLILVNDLSGATPCSADNYSYVIDLVN